LIVKTIQHEFSMVKSSWTTYGSEEKKQVPDQNFRTTSEYSLDITPVIVFVDQDLSLSNQGTYLLIVSDPDVCQRILSYQGGGWLSEEQIMEIVWIQRFGVVKDWQENVRGRRGASSWQRNCFRWFVDNFWQVDECLVMKRLWAYTVRLWLNCKKRGSGFVRPTIQILKPRMLSMNKIGVDW